MENGPIQRKESEALQGNDFYIGISKVNDYYPLHFHDFYEIEIAVDGEGEEIVNGNSYQVTPNTLFLFTPQDYHEIKATKPLTIYNLAFNSTYIDEDTISNFLEYDSNIIINLTPHKTKQVLSVLSIIQDVYQSNRTNKISIIAHLLNAVLLIVIGSQQLKQPIVGPRKDNDVLQYIHKNFAKSPTLEEVADYSGYQRNYFCEIFKEKTGCTYIQYLTQYKINYSKKLLKITKKSIKEVAEECGFNSASNYIREFKKQNNITPNQYRKVYYSQI